jgi:hypothetical protein
MSMVYLSDGIVNFLLEVFFLFDALLRCAGWPILGLLVNQIEFYGQKRISPQNQQSFDVQEEKTFAQLKYALKLFYSIIITHLRRAYKRGLASLGGRCLNSTNLLKTKALLFVFISVK